MSERSPERTTERRKCKGTRLDGRPCEATPTSDGFCCHHTPRYTAADRSAWGKRGSFASIKKRVVEQLQAQDEELKATAPSYATAGDVRTYLERMSAKVERGELMPAQAGAIAQFAALAIKLAELQIEQDMLAHELADMAEGNRPRISLGTGGAR